jgi:hypothetical protein
MVRIIKKHNDMLTMGMAGFSCLIIVLLMAFAVSQAVSSPPCDDSSAANYKTCEQLMQGTDICTEKLKDDCPDEGSFGWKVFNLGSDPTECVAEDPAELPDSIKCTVSNTKNCGVWSVCEWSGHEDGCIPTDEVHNEFGEPVYTQFIFATYITCILQPLGD